jgi:protein tyrosine phosphatase
MLCTRLAEHTDRYIDVYPYITRCALDVISESAMGRAVGGEHEDYVNAVYR